MRPSERPSDRSSSADAGRSVPSVVCAIPARFASTRLPGKALRTILGRSMIEHVVERAREAEGIDRVVVLTDDERIREAVLAFGGECEMTPADCPSGTDRIAWAARGWDAGAVINVQGDEPMLDPAHVSRLATILREEPEVPMVTLASRAEPEDLDDPAKVKVVLDLEGSALYFSRSPIPRSQKGEPAPALRHVGVYGYRRDVLLRLAQLQPTPLERIEALEQLRALEHGIRIRVLEVEHSGFGIDTEADLERARRRMAEAEPRPIPVLSDSSP